LDSQFSFEVQLNLPYEQAIEAVTAALKQEGFGVLTRIDVKATMKEKLGVDFRPYAILGTCNPPLAHRSLEVDPTIGLMLPCNVTVEAAPGGGSIVRIANPEAMMQMGTAGDNPDLAQVAQQARQKLQRVAQSLEQG
jgi:uncharacterized protein (DUF302 family)